MYTNWWIKSIYLPNATVRMKSIYVYQLMDKIYLFTQLFGWNLSMYTNWWIKSNYLPNCSDEIYLCTPTVWPVTHQVNLVFTIYIFNMFLIKHFTVLNNSLEKNKILYPINLSVYLLPDEEVWISREVWGFLLCSCVDQHLSTRIYFGGIPWKASEET